MIPSNPSLRILLKSELSSFSIFSIFKSEFALSPSFSRLLAISRNSVKQSKNLSKKFKPFAKDITLFGIKKTKGALAKKIIDQYKNSKKNLIITFVPNQIYCLAGYWIEKSKPGIFQSIFHEKSKQKINEYKNIKKDVDEFIYDINSEYKSLKKEIKDLF